MLCESFIIIEATYMMAGVGMERKMELVPKPRSTLIYREKLFLSQIFAELLLDIRI